MQELSRISGHSLFKIKNIIYYWLQREPAENSSLQQIKYIVCDATYFHKDGCLAVLFDSITQRILRTLYCHKEGFKTAIGWLEDLKKHGLDPLCATMDGEQGVMRAFCVTWPSVRIQRCLFHIQHEGLRWLRTYPKTEAGKSLKQVLLTLANIKSVKEQKQFIRSYKSWIKTYLADVLALPMNVKASYDLKRTVTLIRRALPDMFHYIYDSNIRSTSSILEALYGRIKQAYRQHSGLTHKHKIQFLKWYCYFENQKQEQQKCNKN